ncbi:MAG TPA: DUF732 domain-containing protein [Mycobacterium sp.]|nr:DUF732 domain-containing protein [Mycobacterium sp.]
MSWTAAAPFGSQPRAYAWPIPLTPDQTSFLKTARGTGFPGDDDQLLMAGESICHQLYSGQSAPAVIDSTAGQYGASPDQAAAVLRAARGTLCTQAPG